MNRALLYVAISVVAGVAIIESSRLILGVGWSWLIAIGYGVVFIALLIAARISKDAPGGRSI
jgi:hypothetical protein